MSTITMYQGPGANAAVVTRSGTKYNAGANGAVAVNIGPDVQDMQGAGYSTTNPTPQDTQLGTVGAMTLTAAQFAHSSGGSDVTLELTGTQVGAFNVTTPTAAQIVTAMNNPIPGQTYRLRVVNQSGGAFTGTLVGGTGVTITGTATIAQNTWRDFIVTITSLTAVAVRSIATGSYS
jgi:hypothetical protein